MDLRSCLQEAAKARTGALPILSFPAAQKLDVSVYDLVRDAQLQAEAMSYIANETSTLAGISLMDLSVEAEAFGAEVKFSENEVPAIVGQLVSCEEDADKLQIPSVDAGRIPVSLQAIRAAKQKIRNKPLLAGMIGPFSLAGRLMDVTQVLFLCRDEPDTVQTVLEKSTEFLIRYGKALKDAGADGIMMAEPLTGILSPRMAKKFSVPYVTQIVEALQDETFAVIYHNCGNTVPDMLDLIFSQNAAAYHFGNAVHMPKLLQAAPPHIICMGNLDPVALFVDATPQTMAKAVEELRAACIPYPNFILSSGCDIPYHADWSNIRAFFRAADK
ncbi:MAG: uroporphyrinogen decarboxylase family protein [Oscillospiraceae bacterium]|nr:uroporphyrinogen decarboxylase family protein [Oscillospiraceae bacterium]